jgi:LacI family transcriptional regulator
LEKNDLPFNTRLVYTCEHVTFEEGVFFAEQILRDHPDVEAIFCTTDLVAVGVLSYFNENNIKVPEQIALMGFSNWFMSQVLTPKLSTIDQPSHEMGKESFNLLLEQMNCQRKGTPFTPKTIELETTVIVRESTLKSI